MPYRTSTITAIGAAAAMLLAGGFQPARAAVTYTDRAAFDAATAGLSRQIVDFDSAASGTLIASGSSFEGVTFTPFSAISLAVTDGTAFGGASAPIPTSSGANFLGSDDFDMLMDGDDIDFVFGSARAFGIYLMSRDPLIDGDFLLGAGGVLVSLLAAEVQQTLIDGTAVYFLGIVDPSNDFTSASLTTTHDGSAGGYFLWNADDLVLARTGQVPEPATLALLAAGLAALAGRRRIAPIQS